MDNCKLIHFEFEADNIWCGRNRDDPPLETISQMI